MEKIPELDPGLLIKKLKEHKTPTFSIDDILDKISEKGMESLTPFEVDYLNKQSKK